MATKNLTANLKKDPHSATAKSEGLAAPAAVQTEEPKAKKKTGRPKVKKGEYKTINIAVPVDVLKQMEVAKLTYGNNLTAYVNAVIKADLDDNYDKYLLLQETINSLNHK
jgi:hypothetical protein